jgi:hypothetical protein
MKDYETLMKYHNTFMTLYGLTTVLSLHGGEIEQAVEDALRAEGSEQHVIDCFKKVLKSAREQCNLTINEKFNL